MLPQAVCNTPPLCAALPICLKIPSPFPTSFHLGASWSRFFEVTLLGRKQFDIDTIHGASSLRKMAKGLQISFVLAHERLDSRLVVKAVTAVGCKIPWVRPKRRDAKASSTPPPPPIKKDHCLWARIPSATVAGLAARLLHDSCFVLCALRSALTDAVYLHLT